MIKPNRASSIEHFITRSMVCFAAASVISATPEASVLMLFVSLIFGTIWLAMAIAAQ